MNQQGIRGVIDLRLFKGNQAVAGKGEVMLSGQESWGEAERPTSQLWR